MVDITPESARCAIGICPGLVDITPPEAACGSFLSSCPGLHDITPPEATCTFGPSCPALFAVPGYETGGIAVIGRVSPEHSAQYASKIGPDEALVIIPRYLYEAIRNQGPVSSPKET